MQVVFEKTFVIRLTEKEAGVIVDLMALISGDHDTLGRSLADGARMMLEREGAVRVCAFDETMEIRSLDGIK